VHQLANKKLCDSYFPTYIYEQVFLPHVPLVNRNHCFENKTMKSISKDVLLQKLALLICFPQVKIFILNSKLLSWQRCFVFPHCLHTNSDFSSKNAAHFTAPPAKFCNNSQPTNWRITTYVVTFVTYYVNQSILTYAMTMSNFQTLFALFGLILTIILFHVRQAYHYTK
jgi:hypothetical protein